MCCFMSLSTTVTITVTYVSGQLMFGVVSISFQHICLFAAIRPVLISSRDFQATVRVVFLLYSISTFLGVSYLFSIHVHLNFGADCTKTTISLSLNPPWH